MQNLTPYEQETIINFNNAERSAEVYTCSPKVMKKFDRLAEEFPQVYSMKSEDEYSKTYIISDKKYVSLCRPRTKSAFTESQRKKISENLMKYHRDKGHNVKSGF